MPKAEKVLLERDAERDIGAELLQSIREMKAGETGAVHGPVTIARYRVRMSQSEFAKLLGVSVRTLQEWEQGRREPSGAARSLIRIAHERPEVLRELFLDEVA
jgi:putative transcriptional regulator